MSHPPDGMSIASGARPQLPYPSYPAHSQHRSSAMRNYRYTLEVVQQPVRARMCGFGDKDRRPITPPPCVRLRVYDENGQEVTNLTDVDCAFFILSVDLWDRHGREEQNLVMHPTNTAVALANTTLPSPNPPNNYGHHHHHYGHMDNNSSYYSDQNYHHHGYQHNYHHYPHEEYAVGPHAPSAGGQFTRNLIGSLTASAFRLKDDHNEAGIWFVLQDLSVRTEGFFKLKFSFLNLGIPPETGDHRRPGVSLNTGRSKILTVAMSDEFQVYSAKKFPGMIESTALSKTFASQGIRIPVRHSNNEQRAAEEDDE